MSIEQKRQFVIPMYRNVGCGDLVVPEMIKRDDDPEVKEHRAYIWQRVENAKETVQKYNKALLNEDTVLLEYPSSNGAEMRRVKVVGCDNISCLDDDETMVQIVEFSVLLQEVDYLDLSRIN